MTEAQPSQVAGAVKEEGSQVASTAVEQGRQTAATTAEAASQVAGAGVDTARQVASEAAQQAAQVTRQATEQARDLVHQAEGQLRDQAATQTQKAAGGMLDVSRQVRALSEGRSEEAGIAADTARQLAEKLEQVAGRLEQRGFDGTVEDLRGFARRRPGLFLLGAAASGFAVTRLARGLQVAQQADETQAAPGVPGLAAGPTNGRGNEPATGYPAPPPQLPGAPSSADPLAPPLGDIPGLKGTPPAVGTW